MVDLADAIRPLAVVAANASREEALVAIDAVATEHVLVGDPQGGGTVLGREEVEGAPSGGPLPDAGGGSPVVFVDAMDALDGLSADDVETLALLLESSGARGIVLIGPAAQVSLLPWDVVADAVSLPLEEARRGEQLYGRAASAVRSYVCHRCDPPTRRLPRAGRATPVCPKHREHGEMELERL